MSIFEIIDSLIDDSKVPTCKRSGEGYASARDAIHEELSTLEDVEVACYHEAGHWVYAVLAANQLGADRSLFEVIGPTVKYDSLKDNYDSAPTALCMGGMEGWLPQNDQHVNTMARIGMAGGEAALHFYPKRKCGNADDIGRFDLLCKDARLRLGGHINPPHVYKNEAIQKIRADLQDPAFAKLIAAKAELIKSQQFGPVFGLSAKVIL